MSVTVRDLLDSKCIPGARIVSGFDGLSNKVSFANVMEILDSPQTVGAGEILISTGYGLEKEENFGGLIEILKTRGVSALALQIGVYIDKIPAYILEKSEELGFPILELPTELSFSELLHILMGKIDEDERKLSANSNEMQKLYEDMLNSLTSSGEPLEIEETESSICFLMLMKCTGGDEKAIEKAQEGIRSYLSAGIKELYYKALPTGASIFFLKIDPKQYCSAIHSLNIHISLLAEETGIHTFSGTDIVSSKGYLQAAFEHADQCMQMLGRINAKQGVCCYEDITYVEFFGNLHRNSDFIVLGNEVMRKMQKYDAQHKTTYMMTLREYLAFSCNITRTAKRLFIHRHTLIHRLETIKELFGLELTNHYARVYISLALMVHDYFGY